MLASTNPKPSKEDFESLLTKTLKQINSLAKSNKLDGSKLEGRNLEPFIENEMNIASKGTPFEGTIVGVGGQKFPDIVAHKYYGVEVKSSKQNHWTTTGNSVLGSTRKEDVERIYMLFGKLSAPIEFKCRPYEECLSEVVVTHSPRYLIDMELPAGETIFDKMRMPYDKLRLHTPPLRPVLEYYRSKLKPGEQIWWLGNNLKDEPILTHGGNSGCPLGDAGFIVMTFWNYLSKEEKDAIRIEGFVFFPEIFSKDQNKFNRMASWMIQERNIFCPNMRDIYSAGGQVTITANGTIYENVPRIIFNGLQKLKSIADLVKQAPIGFLKDKWNITEAPRATALDQWIMIVANEAEKGNKKLKTEQLFRDYIAEHGI